MLRKSIKVLSFHAQLKYILIKPIELGILFVALPHILERRNKFSPSWLNLSTKLILSLKKLIPKQSKPVNFRAPGAISPRGARVLSWDAIK